MPTPPLTRAQVRELDRIAIEEYGIPGAVLMENAGRNAAELVLEEAGAPAASLRIAILCGPGNNGGDGYVMARHLSNAGCEVEVHSTATREGLVGDAALNRRVVDRMGLEVHELLTAHQLEERRRTWARVDVIVDALLGTGFRGEVRPHMARVIGAVGEVEGVSVCAVDVPSGMDCDSGQGSNATVRATYTVTFVAPKVGFLVAGAEEWTGRVQCVGIGAPVEIVGRVIRGG